MAAHDDHEFGSVGRPALAKPVGLDVLIQQFIGVQFQAVARHPNQPQPQPHPPREPSASQDGAGATISTADDLRVALNVEGLGVLSETVVVLPNAITTPTDEVLH